MEPNTTLVTPASVGIRYGLLTGLLSIIVSFGLNVAHLDQSPAKWLSTIILIGGIFLAQRFYKDQNAGFMNYGQGMGMEMIATLVSGVLERCLPTST